jgi:hypothetical protein
MVQRLAREKAAAVVSDAVIVAADTAVVLGEVAYAKPDDDEHARAMLRALSGKTHENIGRNDAFLGSITPLSESLFLSLFLCRYPKTVAQV